MASTSYYFHDRESVKVHARTIFVIKGLLLQALGEVNLHVETHIFSPHWPGTRWGHTQIHSEYVHAYCGNTCTPLFSPWLATEQIRIYGVTGKTKNCAGLLYLHTATLTMSNNRDGLLFNWVPKNKNPFASPSRLYNNSTSRTISRYAYTGPPH